MLRVLANVCLVPLVCVHEEWVIVGELFFLCNEISEGSELRFYVMLLLMKITAVILSFSQFVAFVNSDDEKSSLEIKKTPTIQHTTQMPIELKKLLPSPFLAFFFFFLVVKRAENVSLKI